METHQRLTNPIAHWSIIIIIFAVGLLTLFSHTVQHAITPHSHRTAVSAISTGPCIGPSRHTYTLTVKDQGIAPDHINAQRCDSLKIINASKDEIIMALGPHNHHTHYPGFEEKELQPGQDYSFRLSESGSFPLHDHDNEGLRATLDISEK